MTLVKRDRNRRPKRKVCSFCADKIEHIDYKDVAKLRRFILVVFLVTVLAISVKLQLQLKELVTSLFYLSQLNNKYDSKSRYNFVPAFFVRNILL